MQTHLIYSNTKHGALVAILEKLKTNLPSNREQVVIVPDKFSLNTEKFIMEHLGLSSTTQINVTSLDRMADIYCKNLNLNYLSKFGGIMLVQKILLDNSKQLNVFKKSYKYSGFCEDLFNNIMLLKSCNVTPQGLLNSAQNLDAFSKLKISEIAFIFQTYEDYLKERFYDSANKLTILKQQMQLDNNFDKVDFYYAMFDDYTPQALSVIETLGRFAHSQTFGLLKNQRQHKWDFFNDIATQKINSLFLNENGTTISNFNEYFPLSKNTIQNYIGTKNQNVATLDSDISFWQANNAQEEIEFICKSIAYRVHNENARYKQISVAVGNLENLQAELEQCFNKYNIPYFIDVSKPLSQLMLSKFLFSIFDAIINNYQQKDILAILKSPFVECSYEEKQLFENYILANNIDNEKIFQSFTRGAEEELVLLNVIRENICKFIDYFNENMKKTQKIYDFCQIIKDFFAFLDLENKLVAFCEQINELGINTLSNQNKQCLNGIINILNELQSIFGLTEITFKHFLELLTAGCESMNVSSAPNSVDQVFIGDSNTSIFGQNDYFYFVNCVENFFPVSQNDCGLIVDSEINNLNEKILIEPTIKEINKKSIFNAYNNIFLYQKEVCFSYALNSLLKEEQKPSSFLLDIIALFSLNNGKSANFINIQNYFDSDIEKALIMNNITPYSATKNVLKFSGLNIQSLPQLLINNAILYTLDKNNLYPTVVDNVRDLNIKGNIKAMQKIIENKQTFSVSQIENYYNCPYMHFAKYILNLRQKPQGVFQAFDIGNFLHKVAEYFFNDLIKNNKKCYNDDEIAQKIEKIIEKIENNDYFSIFFKNKDQDLLLMALEKEAIRMCYAFNEQAKHSSFQVKETELSFKISLKELGSKDLNVEFFGKVDRLDEFGKYFRIVDYKTGSEKFNIANLYYGKKIQLHLYAYALQKKKKNLACGIFYSPIKDDFVKDTNDNKKQEFYKLDGILLDDPNLALAQDDTLGLDKLKSEFIPVKFKKTSLENSGEYEFDNSSSKVLSKDSFEAQLHYSLLAFTQAIKEIKDGNIEPSPFKDGTMIPCDYCPFSVACGFDEQKGNCYRELEKNLKFDEIFKELKDA